MSFIHSIFKVSTFYHQSIDQQVGYLRSCRAVLILLAPCFTGKLWKEQKEWLYSTLPGFLSAAPSLCLLSSPDLLMSLLMESSHLSCGLPSQLWPFLIDLSITAYNVINYNLLHSLQTDIGAKCCSEDHHVSAVMSVCFSSWASSLSSAPSSTATSSRSISCTSPSLTSCFIEPSAPSQRMVR